MENKKVRVPIRTKMFFLVLILLISASGAILWKTRQIFFEDKFDFVKQLSNKLSSSTSSMSHQKLNELQNKLALFVSQQESLKEVRSSRVQKEKVLFDRYKEFLVVSAQTKRGSKWVTDWKYRNPNQKIAWQSQYDETLLRSLNFNKYEPGQVYLTRLKDKKSNPIFAMSVIAELRAADRSGKARTVALVSFLDTDFLKEIVRAYKGDLNTVFVMDQKGFVYAHPNDSLIGAAYTTHPIVSEVLSKGRTSGSGEYGEGKNSIIGSYASIAGTNLLVVVTTPTKHAFLAANQLLIAVLMFGLSFVIMGLGLAYYMSSRITNPIEKLQEAASVIGGGDFTADINVYSNDEVGDLADSINKMKVSLLERDEALEHSKVALVQSEKMSAFGQLSAGIAHEVKNPLAGILGHAQLAKTKVQEEGVKKHLELIEKEARRTKEIVENLMKFARAEKPELEETDLYETVSRAVDLVDHQLSLQEIKIFRELKSVPKAMANSNQLQQVLLNIMMNAGHAMEEAAKKELHVGVHQVGDNVQIYVRDTGKGMSKEVQEKIFEPFFTTKPAGKGTGLGMSVSIGIVEDHNGKIYCESEEGQGTTFFIDIPKIAGSVAPEQPSVADETTEASAVPHSAAASPAPSQSPTPIKSEAEQPVAKQETTQASETKETKMSHRQKMSVDYQKGIDSFDSNRGIKTKAEVPSENSTAAEESKAAQSSSESRAVDEKKTSTQQAQKPSVQKKKKREIPELGNEFKAVEYTAKVKEQEKLTYESTFSSRDSSASNESKDDFTLDLPDDMDIESLGEVTDEDMDEAFDEIAETQEEKNDFKVKIRKPKIKA